MMPIFYYMPYQAQAKACAGSGFFGGKICREDVCFVFFGDSGAIVFNSDFDLIAQ